MPLKWRVLPENKFPLTEKQFEAASVLKDYIVTRDKALKYERDNEFPYPSVPRPSVFRPENSGFKCGNER